MVKAKNFIVLSVFCIISLSSFAQLNIDSLKQIIASEKDEVMLMKAINDYAFQLYRIKPDTAIFYAEKALQIDEKINNNAGIYSAYNALGLSYHSKGLYKLSLDYFNKALANNEIIDYEKAKIYHNIALTYKAEGNDNNALDFELKAINILEHNKDTIALGTVYQSLCNIYRHRGGNYLLD